MAKDIISLQDFLNPNNGETEREVHLSRFASPFIIHPITEGENAELEKRATRKVKSKSGNDTKELNVELYMNLLMLNCLDERILEVLKNEEVQARYNSHGSQIETLKNMLRPGEYRELFAKVQEINGFNEDSDLVEDVEDIKE